MITRIEIDSETEDVAFVFDDSEEYFSPLEFEGDTLNGLLDIVDEIYNFNHRGTNET